MAEDDCTIIRFARGTPDPGPADEYLSAAADRALAVLPGPVGELVHREIRAYLEFGHRFGTDAGLMRRLARELLDG